MHGCVVLSSEFCFVTESRQNTMIFNFVALIAAISFLLWELQIVYEVPLHTKQRIRICRVQTIMSNVNVINLLFVHRILCQV